MPQRLTKKQRVRAELDEWNEDDDRLCQIKGGDPLQETWEDEVLGVLGLALTVAWIIRKVLQFIGYVWICLTRGDPHQPRRRTW